jgi:probable phosphoglycerate mutase
MKNIYIVRHTESIHHVKGLAGGWFDTSLTDTGKEQARKIAAALLDEVQKPGTPIYSSDLKRCSEMADIIAAVFGSTVTLDRDLREMSGGDCEGKPEDWVRQNVRVLTTGNRIDHRAFNNAESRGDVGRRMYAFLDRVLKKPDEDIFLITHGFAMGFLIMAWLKVPVENMDYGDFSKTRPGSVTLLYEDDLWKNRYVVYVGRQFPAQASTGSLSH